MAKFLIATTKNHIPVHLDTEKSHALTHFKKHPNLLSFVQKLIPTIDATEDMIRLDKDMGETVGTTDLVETNEHDEIIYAMRPLRNTYSRFVKNKSPIPTNWITIDIRKNKQNEYELYTAFIGKLTPSFPGGNFKQDESIDFWNSHALVWGSQDVVEGSETSICPWGK